MGNNRLCVFIVAHARRTNLLRLFLEVLANAAVELFGGLYALKLRRHIQLVRGVIRATMNLEDRVISASLRWVACRC